MLHAKLTIRSIDFEKTVRALFPTVLNKLADKKADSPLGGMIRSLGGDAEALVLDFLAKTPASLLRELICQGADSYPHLIAGKVNGILKKSDLGSAVTVGRIRLEPAGEGLTVYADNVDADLRSLLTTPSVQAKISSVVSAKAGDGMVGRLAVKAVESILSAIGSMDADKAEGKGVELLKRPELKNRLLSMVGSKLLNKGIFAELGDLELSCGPAVRGLSDTPDALRLDDDLTRRLTAAASAYLRGLVK